jgi:uncharacterized membrane protein
MLGIITAFGVAVFKTGTDVTFKFANKIIPNDRSLLFYQRAIETLIALGLILFIGFNAEAAKETWLFDTSFWLLSVVTVLIAGSALYFYIKALRYSDVSLVAPMMLLTPAVLLVTSPIILGEHTSLAGALGVLFIVIGSYVMGFSVKKAQKFSFLTPFTALSKERGVRYALAASFLYGIAAPLDKIGVLQSSPFIWIFVQGALLVIGLGIFMFIKERSSFVLSPKQSAIAVIPGFTGAISSLLQMFAISLWHVPYVIAVKRLSSLFTIIAGGALFKEKGILLRLGGALFMIIGVLFILFFG